MNVFHLLRHGLQGVWLELHAFYDYEVFIISFLSVHHSFRCSCHGPFQVVYYITDTRCKPYTIFLSHHLNFCYRSLSQPPNLFSYLSLHEHASLLQNKTCTVQSQSYLAPVPSEAEASHVSRVQMVKMAA